MKKNLNSYLKLLRVKDWRGYFLLGIFGFLISKGFLFPLSHIILFFLIGFLLLAFGFSVNDCFDIKEDSCQKEKEIIVKREINFKKSLFFSISLGILALILSAFFGIKVFIFSLISALIGFFYSAPPLRFKSKPFLDLISHGFFAGVLIFFFPLIVFKVNLDLIHYLIALPVFYLSIIAELRNHLEDFLSDKLAGLKTTVCFFGKEKSQKLLKFLVAFSPLAFLPPFLLTSFNYLFSFFFISLIFLSFLLFKKNSKIVKSYLLFNIYILLSFAIILIATK